MKGIAQVRNLSNLVLRPPIFTLIPTHAARNEQTCTRAFHKMVGKILKVYGYKRYKNARPQKHLGYYDQATIDYRHFVNTSTEKHNVHPRLIAYWDQIWVCLMTPASTVLWKDCMTMTPPRTYSRSQMGLPRAHV